MKTITLEIEQIKEKTIPILKEAGVSRSAIFGSFAAGENTKDSDIDILVDLPEGKTLFDLVDLQTRLEEVLGKKVDVITYNSIYPPLEKYILGEQVPLL